MKIALAQINSTCGDIENNIRSHVHFIIQAVSAGADAIFFPELSITAYEPTLAAQLASNENDSRFRIFQEISDSKDLIIGVGMPLITQGGIMISMLLFQPSKSATHYTKKYIHADEEPFFIKGENPPGLLLNQQKIALAICYEISVPQHAEQSFKDGASVYVASVVKTPSGVNNAIDQLSLIATKYSMPVLMVNAIGFADGGVNGGKSSAWTNKGELIAQLPADEEALLVYDTVSNQCQIVNILQTTD